MATTEDAWRRVERWAKDGGSNDRCILELRARVEPLEQRAPAPAPEPAPAPAADRPLWEVMYDNCCDAARKGDLAWRTAAEIDAVAAWLADREHCGAASLLRIEARRAQEALSDD